MPDIFTGKKLKNLLLLVVGNGVLALGVQAFIVPHGFITGGVTGIALALQDLIPLPFSALVALFNAALFLLGAALLGRNFALSTLLSTILYPLFLHLFEMTHILERLENALAEDVFLCAVLGGLLMGAGIGFALRSGSSTGGTDVLPVLAKKYWNIPLAQGMVIADLAVLVAQVFGADLRAVAYGIVTVVLGSVAIDKVMIAGESQLQMTVISPKAEEIRESLLVEQNLGVTMLAMETGYQAVPGMAIMSVMPSRKYPPTRQLILSVDPEAFIIVNKVSEVNGRGYTLPDNSLPPVPKAER